MTWKNIYIENYWLVQCLWSLEHWSWQLYLSAGMKYSSSPAFWLPSSLSLLTIAMSFSISVHPFGIHNKCFSLPLWPSKILCKILSHRLKVIIPYKLSGFYCYVIFTLLSKFFFCASLNLVISICSNLYILSFLRKSIYPASIFSCIWMTAARILLHKYINTCSEYRSSS